MAISPQEKPVANPLVEEKPVANSQQGQPMANPMKEEPPVAKPVIVQYPITVECIVSDLSDYNDMQIHAIRDYCNKVHVLFTTRIYDSYAYSRDRDVIERLPAFHVSIQSVYNRTFYLNTRTMQHIDECITIYTERQEHTKRRRQRVRNIFTSVLTWIKRIGHRKTMLERMQEAKPASPVERRPSFMDRILESGKIPVNEWN